MKYLILVPILFTLSIEDIHSKHVIKCAAEMMSDLGITRPLETTYIDSDRAGKILPEEYNALIQPINSINIRGNITYFNGTAINREVFTKQIRLNYDLCVRQTKGRF